MKKIVTLSLLLVLAIAGVLWATLRRDEVQPPPAGENVRVTAPANAGGGGARGGVVEPLSREGAPDRPTPPPADASWQLEVFVCDTRGQPIAGAEVTMLENTGLVPERVLGASGARVVGRSDAGGRCAATVTGKACMLAARHGDGRESATAFAKAADAARGSVVLQLLAEVQLQGVVLGDGGVPVFDATVSMQQSMVPGEFVARGATAVCGEVKTAEDGRFVLRARQGSLLRLTAHVGSRSSFPRDVVVPIDDAPPLVELRLKGTITVSGMVRDEAGVPAVDVVVHARRAGQAHEVLRDEGLRAFTVHGRFRMDLPDYGEFDLFASSSGHGTSERVRVQVSPDELTPEVELRLRPMAQVTGVVVDGNGVPLPDVAVMAMPSFTELADLMPGRDGPRVRDLSVRTAADGTFSMPLDPGTTFTLVVRGEGERKGACTIVPEVTGGATGLHIVLAPQAGTVRGVVARADGGEVGAFRVSLLIGGGAWRGPERASATIDGARFSVPTTTRGGEILINVEPQSPELAPASLGPFAADGSDLDVEVVLQPWGQLPVRVVDRSGWPVFGARVWRADRPMPLGESPITTDLDGRATLPRCPPGPARIAIERFGVRAPEAKVQIVSGANPELRVQLR